MKPTSSTLRIKQRLWVRLNRPESPLVNGKEYVVIHIRITKDGFTGMSLPEKGTLNGREQEAFKSIWGDTIRVENL